MKTSCVPQTPSTRHLHAKTPSSRDSLTWEGHLDACEDAHSTPPSSIKTLDLRQRSKGLFPLQESQTLHTCTLSIPSINSAFTSCWLAFHFWPKCWPIGLPIWGQGWSWLLLQEAPGNPGPDLPASASTCRSSRMPSFVVSRHPCLQ